MRSNFDVGKHEENVDEQGAESPLLYTCSQLSSAESASSIPEPFAKAKPN